MAPFIFLFINDMVLLIYLIDRYITEIRNDKAMPIIPILHKQINEMSVTIVVSKSILTFLFWWPVAVKYAPNIVEIARNIFPDIYIKSTQYAFV